MRSKRPALRHLSLDHLVFYRAFMEGTIDLADLAKRYLETGDNRPAAKRTLLIVQNALIAAARRAGKHGQARLLKLPVSALRTEASPVATPPPRAASLPTPAQAIPSFEDFTAEKDPDGHFSVEELWDIYQDEYGNPAEVDTSAATAPTSNPRSPDSRRLERNSRLARKRLQLIADLSPELARPPQPHDDIRAWFDESVTAPLVQQGIVTLDQVVSLANTWGYKWERRVPKFGPVRAKRLIDWLAKYQDDLGLTLSAYAITPRHRLPKAPRGVMLAMKPAGVLHQAPPPSPFAPTLDGLYRPPSHLDGSVGRNRVLPVPPDLAGALSPKAAPADDFEAILAWLSIRNKAGQAHTQRSYRTAVERLLLWSAFEKKTAISSLGNAEIPAFLAWLSDPVPHDTWVGTRNVRRTDPAWRPFLRNADGKAGLSPSSVRQTAVILRNLFSWLVRIRYLERNPFDPLPLPPAPASHHGGPPAEYRYTEAQWQVILNAADHLPDTTLSVRRLRALLHLAHATRLRLQDLANARVDHLQGPVLTVPGKIRSRDIALAPEVLHHLGCYLAARELSLDTCPAPTGTPLIAKLYATRETWAMSPSAIYTVITTFAARHLAGAGTNVKDGLSCRREQPPLGIVKSRLEFNGLDHSQYPQ